MRENPHRRGRIGERRLRGTPYRALHSGELWSELWLNKFEEIFKNWTTQIESKYDKLLDTVNIIKEQNTMISSSMEFFSAKYDELTLQIQKLQNSRKDDQIYIHTLERKIENIERNARVSSVELRNIPVNKNESKEDLCVLVKKIGQILDMPIKTSDCRNIYRGFSKTESKKPIILEFNSVIQKDKMLLSYKQYNKSNKTNNLNLSHININGPPTKIYITEYLSSKMKRLHFLAREYASSNGYRFCWPTPGCIYMRKNEGDLPIQLKNEEDLKNLQET
ncbi:hypothetical protein K1T71_006762 [Dendrolimus kikuchii]|uniref:Uncharacterized protein n=1 Tax=Dendrolimus kikuchii TaxID=765133 RepID=A0ACC1D1Q5_9NEOP|nr:hypothetical protein K1T71_006762 [Dendrolimus kikuchii]